MPVNDETLALCQKCIGDKINFPSDTKASFVDLLLKCQIFVKKPNYFLRKFFLPFES